MKLYDNLSEQEQVELIRKRAYWLIRFIANPSLAVQLAAVRQSGGAISFIINPSLEVQLAAVKQNGFAILDISNPSNEVKIAAVKQNPLALCYIRVQL